MNIQVHQNITTESLLFQDAFTTNLACPSGVFRRARAADAASMFPHKHEGIGDWVVEAHGAVVATGGFLYHYNPPYGDIYMQVSEPARKQGIGSYLVQEVKRVCCESGKKPTARCNPANIASRLTL
jgi:GNAT superfamily N-acetyltransferase